MVLLLCYLAKLCALFVLLMQTISDLFALFPYNFHYSLWAIFSVTYHFALCFGFHPCYLHYHCDFLLIQRTCVFLLRDAFSFCQTLYKKHEIPLSVPEEWKKHIPRWYQKLAASILLGNIEFRYFSQRRGACQCLQRKTFCV